MEAPRCLKVAMVEYPIMMEVFGSPPNVTYVGPVVTLLHLLADQLDLCYEFLDLRFEQYGQLMDNGSWTGLMGLLQRSEVDLGGTLFSVTWRRWLAVDFSTALYLDQSNVIYARPEVTSDMTAFVKPYTLLVWLVLFLVSLMMFIATSLLLWSHKIIQALANLSIPRRSLSKFPLVAGEGEASVYLHPLEGDGLLGVQPPAVEKDGRGLGVCNFFSLGKCVGDGFSRGGESYLPSPAPAWAPPLFTVTAFTHTKPRALICCNITIGHHLPPHSTNFKAELVAILLALRHACEMLGEDTNSFRRCLDGSHTPPSGTTTPLTGELRCSKASTLVSLTISAVFGWDIYAAQRFSTPKPAPTAIQKICTRSSNTSTVPCNTRSASDSR
ncbi:hypothetical protein O3P69_006259 [Scylla paramamosain]|uniref:Ionotropic glutamate receptor L-glutamate and glycine-binding domain-containing protein n=1 Tax=Scylla paramamosain TaxID=85552 RepID=A0AAW0U9R1_SCYPA